MLRLGRYVVKKAEFDGDFEQIHRLNHRTFIQELPQLRDGLNRDKHTFFMALRDDRLVGLLTVQSQPPLSICERLSDSKLMHQPGMKPLEVKLLAVEPEERQSPVMILLVHSMHRWAESQGYTHFAISGMPSQLELYKHMGFEELGPPVGRPGAQTIPMMASLDRVYKQLQRTFTLWERRLQREASSMTMEPISMLPGPVPLAPEVRQAFAEPLIYHRGPEFITLHEDVRRTLEQMTSATSVALFVGSGTLANEAVAATLAADPAVDRGLMLVSGEFGRRLLKQARRHRIRPRVLEWAWGQAWDLDQIAEEMDQLGEGGWVWGVHQESSTGVLNDLQGLINLAKPRGIRVCADCVSSLGAGPLDLSNIYLASGATGKALSSYAGIALVFGDPAKLSHLDTDDIPSYWDLPATFASVGPRYTIPSPLIKALDVALRHYRTPEKCQARYDHYAELGAYVRHRLTEIGLPPLADEEHTSPVITSFLPPGDESAYDFVNRCMAWGYHIGGQSGYLMEQRVVQIANMGTICKADLEGLLNHLERWMARQRRLQTVGT